MLVRCPFITLSANVGEPVFFQNWLSRVGKPFALSKANEPHLKEQVVLIHHHLRCSDLQKYIYLPNAYLEEGAYETGIILLSKFSFLMREERKAAKVKTLVENFVETKMQALLRNLQIVRNHRLKFNRKYCRVS